MSIETGQAIGQQMRFSLRCQPSVILKLAGVNHE